MSNSTDEQKPQSFAEQMAAAGLLSGNKDIEKARHRTTPDNQAADWWNRPQERILFGIFCLLFILVAVVAYAVLG